MPELNVLISGAGIAGPILAFWLSRAGIKCTVVERAPELRTAGQQIDVRGAALEVVRRMGLEETVRSHTTDERGLAFVDAKGTMWAKFPVDSKAGQSFTSDIEILRGELAKVFYDATQSSTRYIFGDHVTGVAEDASGVSVDFAKGPTEHYDLIVAADGMRSSTRRLVFGADRENTYRTLNQYTSFFTIPVIDPTQNWAQWYNAPGGRLILLRPDNSGTHTRAYVSIMGQACKGYEKLDVAGQKELMAGLFQGAGWETDKVLAGMHEADDFYMQEIAQVKMPRWSKGRVALLGDAGFCPSPISGMGTSLAIVSAYVLAGEIVRHGDNVGEAFEAYEAHMRPIVESAQSLIPGAPAIANPISAWGITVLYSFLSFVAWTGVASWLAGLGGPSIADKIKLPDYEM